MQAHTTKGVDTGRNKDHGCLYSLLCLLRGHPPLEFFVSFSSIFFDLCMCTYIHAHTWYYFVSFQFSSVAQSCPTLCNSMDCSTPGLTVHHQLLEFTQTHVHCVGHASNHLISCHSLLFPPSIFPSFRVFSIESVLPSCGQSIRVSPSASVFPMNIQD